MLFKKLTLIGVGLIGGSLVRALRGAEQVEKVIGYDVCEESLKKAQELGVINDYSTDIAEAVTEADMVIVAVPLGAMPEIFKGIAEHIKPRCVISDVGSAKGAVVNAAREALGEKFKQFVPAHPIAGREKSGVEASIIDLFDAHKLILTPVDETDHYALDIVTQMWCYAGAQVIELTVEHHDRVLAATSHLPHMLAYALVDALATMQESEEIFQFAAGGFSDFTRIASSDPEMWHDICFSNRDELLKMLDNFDEHIDKIRQAIISQDSTSLLQLFQGAKAARDNFICKRDS